MMRRSPSSRGDSGIHRGNVGSFFEVSLQDMHTEHVVQFVVEARCTPEANAGEMERTRETRHGRLVRTQSPRRYSWSVTWRPPAR